MPAGPEVAPAGPPLEWADFALPEDVVKDSGPAAVTAQEVAVQPNYYKRAIFGSKWRKLQTGVAAVKSYGNHIGDGGLVPGIMGISRRRRHRGV